MAKNKDYYDRHGKPRGPSSEIPFGVQAAHNTTDYYRKGLGQQKGGLSPGRQAATDAQQQSVTNQWTRHKQQKQSGLGSNLGTAERVGNMQSAAQRQGGAASGFGEVGRAKNKQAEQQEKQVHMKPVARTDLRHDRQDIAQAITGGYKGKLFKPGQARSRLKRG